MKLPEIMSLTWPVRGWSFRYEPGATHEEQYAGMDWPDALGERPTLEAILANTTAAQAIVDRRAAAQAAIAAGYLVEPEGFRLRLTSEASDLFAKLRTQVVERLALGVLTNDSLITIIDQSDVPRQVTAARFREIIFAYGQQFTELWFQLR